MIELTDVDFASTRGSDNIDIWNISKNTPIRTLIHKNAGDIWAICKLEAEIIASGSIK